jgi:hypothetical protein
MGILLDHVCFPSDRRGRECREQQTGSVESWRSVSTWRRPWLWIVDQNVSNAWAGIKICCAQPEQGGQNDDDAVCREATDIASDRWVLENRGEYPVRRGHEWLGRDR